MALSAEQIRKLVYDYEAYMTRRSSLWNNQALYTNGENADPNGDVVRFNHEPRPIKSYTSQSINNDGDWVFFNPRPPLPIEEPKVEPEEDPASWDVERS